MDSGLPQNTVQTLLQSRNGFLWIGTESGLARFDGVQFQVYDRNSTPALPASNDVCCLFESPDGALWIGTGEGLVRIQNGEMRLFNAQNGLPGNRVRALARGDGNTPLVYTDQGLARWDSDRFVVSDSRQAAASIAAFSRQGATSFNSAAGELTNHLSGSSRLARENISFTAVLNSTESAVATANLLVVLRSGRAIAALRTGKQLPGNRIQTLLADREGALWIGTSEGLARWRDGRLERFPVTDPLATDSVLALMEDREDDLWVGTESGGLHILRDPHFRTFGLHEGLTSEAATAITEAKDGTLWVGTQDNGLLALALRPGNDGLGPGRAWTVANGLASNVVLALAAAPDGDLWAGTPDGLNRIHGGRLTTYTSIDGLPDDFVRSLLVDTDGSLWIGTRRGLTHWSRDAGHSTMRTYTHADGLGSDLVGAMARDAKGSLWVATLAGLARLDGSTIRNFTTHDGLPGNVVTALLALSDGRLLIGTQDHGWAVWDGSFFRAVSAGNTEAVHAILDDNQGHLWFATGSGIARCDALTPEAMCTRWTGYGTADGLRSREIATNSHPSAWRSHNGILWFATPKGLVEVDPAHFPALAPPPPVAIERFAVDDLNQPLSEPGTTLRIAAGHVRFAFDYAGLSFAAPLKVRYRYMLEGFDRGWIEAGSRRTAYYTNVPPGRYTFRVEASNNNGQWSTADAALRFELRPRFYQTLWFYALLLAAVAVVIVLFLRLRLRRAEHAFCAVLAERSRIAREIHDTLAQGYVGVSVQLEVLAEFLRQHKIQAATSQLDQTRAFVREGLADARQSIWALRTHDSGEATLPVKLRRMTEAAGDSALAAHFSLFGAYRPLAAAAEQELLRVAQEAVRNVKRHAGASELHVQLEYSPTAVTLNVRDNGRGGATVSHAQAGHFGITGMRERAEAIGGTLEVFSPLGAGTSVRLCAPAPEAAREPSGVAQ